MGDGPDGSLRWAGAVTGTGNGKTNQFIDLFILIWSR